MKKKLGKIFFIYIIFHLKIASNNTIEWNFVITYQPVYNFEF